MRLGSASGVTHLTTVGRHPDVPGGSQPPSQGTCSRHEAHGPFAPVSPRGADPAAGARQEPSPDGDRIHPKIYQSLHRAALSTGTGQSPKTAAHRHPSLGCSPPRECLKTPGGHRGESRPQAHRGVCRWHIPGPSRRPAAHGGAARAACRCAPALTSQRGQEGGGFPPGGDPASASTARGSPATCSATDNTVLSHNRHLPSVTPPKGARSQPGAGAGGTDPPG